MAGEFLDTVQCVILRLLNAVHATEKDIRMTKIRCLPCNGSGRMMGGGMLMQDCEHCDGKGKIEDGKVQLADYKKTPEYRKAINTIQQLANKSYEESERLFAEEFDKKEEIHKEEVKPIPKIPGKRGRPARKEIYG